MMNKIKGVLYDDGVIVWDIESAKMLYKNGFYGKYLGVRKAKELEMDKPLQLSLIEAVYLFEKNILEVYLGGRKLSYYELRKIASSKILLFEDIYIVYKDLRDRGYVVKSGMKFGATFAVYEHGPGIDHAPFLVHVLSFEDELDPLEIVRAGRLSHSVRKKFVIAVVDPISRKPYYYIFKWFG